MFRTKITGASVDMFIMTIAMQNSCSVVFGVVPCHMCVYLRYMYVLSANTSSNAEQTIVRTNPVTTEPVVNGHADNGPQVNRTRIIE